MEFGLYPYPQPSIPSQQLCQPEATLSANAFKSLNYTTDIENVKNNFMASLEVASTAKQNHAPVNANLAGAF